MTPAKIRVEEYTHDGYVGLTVKAGPRGRRRIVPPAGEDHAFWVEDHARRIEVSVSPTGRSVRVWVDGQQVSPPA